MAKSPPPPICLLRGHEGAISALHFTNEESSLIKNPTLISGSDVGEIWFWDLKSFRTYHKFKGHDRKRILYICFFQSALITHGRNGTVCIWKCENDYWNPTEVLNCPNYGFCSASVFTINNFTYLIAPSGEGSALTFYDYKKRTVLHTLQSSELSIKEAKPMCMCLKVLSYGSNLSILTGFDDGHVILWDYLSKKEKSRLKCHPEVVFCLDYDSVHQNRGISGSCDNVLQLWEIKDDSLNKIHSFKVANPGISAVRIRPDGKIVITGGQDGNVRVFSWKNLKPLAVLQFHAQEICTLEFFMNKISKYESVFASGSKDKNICLWSIY